MRPSNEGVLIMIRSQRTLPTEHGFFLFGIYLFITLVLVACNSPALPPVILQSPSPPPDTEIFEETITPSETLAPLPTTTLTPVITETPAITSIPIIEIKPFITPEGMRARFDSWGSDSLWIAYWLAEDEEAPASLTFTHVVSGETCQPEEVQAQSLGSDLLLWQEDGSVIVLPSGFPQGALQGIPCGAFVPVEGETLPDPLTRTSLSPDGSYVAEEIIVQQEEAGFHIELQITEFGSGQSLHSMSYLLSRHFVFGGPKWLNNDYYLIGMALDQGLSGFLYYSVAEDRVSQVLPDVLGLEAEKYVSLFTQTNPDDGTFHILVLSEDLPLLYHSEFDQLEELPFAHVGNFADASGGLSLFSLDGKWLLLSQVVGGHYWLRSVDPPGSTSTELTYYGDVGGLSHNGQRLAFLHGKSINIVSFPSGELLSQWHTSIYDIQNIWWSPDSNRFIALGHQSESNQIALYVIEP